MTTHNFKSRASRARLLTGDDLEFKFAGDTGLPDGEFLAYASVFGKIDAHGDVVVKGAFAKTLERRKTDGRGSVPMHAMHRVFGGDGLPVGVWKSVQEDDYGLRVHGKISGIETDQGKLTWSRLIDGAYGGLSIGYWIGRFDPGDGDVKRFLTEIELVEISLVDEPSNASAVIDRKGIQLADISELVRLLIEGGLSRSAARNVATKGWDGLVRHDKPRPGPDPAEAAAIDALLTKLETGITELKTLEGKRR